MTAKTNLPEVLPALADVAMIDGPTIAAAAAISMSQFHDLVRTGQAPQPAFRAPRCTRWRLVDAREWLIDRAAKADPEVGERMTARAKKASIKAREPAAVAKARATRKARIAAREGVAT